MVSEEKAFDRPSLWRTIGWWLTVVAAAIVLIFASVVFASDQHVVRYGGPHGATYGNCQVFGDLAAAVCTPVDGLESYGAEQVRVGSLTYGNCQPNGDKHVFTGSLSTTIGYDSITCYRLTGGI